MKRKVLFGCISAIFCMGTYSTNIFASDLSGKYICEWHDPFSNEDNKMPLTVTKTKETYHFEVVDQSTKDKYIGTGVYNPSRPDTLAVVYTGPKELIYVALYNVQKNGSLNSVWTFHGKDRTSTEICKKI